MTDKADLFARLQSLEHKFTAYFGSESKDVFEAVWSVRAKVHSSARMLIETAADERADRPDNKSIQDWQNDIWYGLVEGDELSKKIAGVVEKMEKICAPHLK